MSGTGAFVGATRVAAVGAVTSGPARLRGLWINALAAGEVTLTDGNGGTTLLQVSVQIGADYLPIGAGTEGILFKTSIYLSAIPAASSSITAIYD